MQVSDSLAMCRDVHVAITSLGNFLIHEDRRSIVVDDRVSVFVFFRDFAEHLDVFACVFVPTIEQDVEGVDVTCYKRSGLMYLRPVWRLV